MAIIMVIRVIRDRLLEEAAARPTDIVVSGKPRQRNCLSELTSQQGTQLIIVALAVSQHMERALVQKL